MWRNPLAAKAPESECAMAIVNTTVAQTCPDVFLEWHHAPKAGAATVLSITVMQQSPCNSELQWSSRAAATLRASCDRRQSVDATGGRGDRSAAQRHDFR